MSLVETNNEQEEIIQTDAPESGEAGQSQQPESVGENEGFELVFNGDTDAPEVNQNAVQAAKRIARKSEAQMQETIDKLKGGEISDELKVNVELPPKPDVNNYLSDSSLEKYDYDTNKALAAFQSDQNQWMIDVNTAQTSAAAKQNKAVSDYINQSSQIKQHVTEHYDNAEKFGIDDIDEVEDRIKQKLPQGWYENIIVAFPDKSAAIFKHLDMNPQKLQGLMDNPQFAMRDVTRIADALTFKPKATLSKAPKADEPMSHGDSGSDKAAIMESMKKAADKGDVKEYRRLKSLLQRYKLCLYLKAKLSLT